MERKLMSEALQGQGAHLQIVRKRLKGSPTNAFMIAVIFFIYIHFIWFERIKIGAISAGFQSRRCLKQKKKKKSTWDLSEQERDQE